MPDTPCLILVGTGSRVPLVEGLTVGRGPENALRLEDASVSTRHAAFRQVGGAWMVQDLGSTNGTWVNEERVQERAWLKEGDRLRFGMLIARVEGLAPTQSAVPPQPPPIPRPAPPPIPQAPPLPMAQAALPPPIPAPRRKRWGCLLGGGALVLILAGLGAWMLLGRQGGRMDNSVAFREAARGNPPGAFQKVLAPEMQGRLGAINEALWPTVDAPVGWAFFFSTSIVSGAPERDGRKPVLFYNPWADVGLLTLWKAGSMVNLEMVPGRLLRGEGPPYGSIGWASQEAYGPHGVGYTTAQTVRAFEKAFAGQAALEAVLPTTSPEALRVACGLQMAQVVRSLLGFSQPMNNPVRVAYIRLMAEGSSALERAKGTRPESAAALRALPKEAWGAFKPTTMLDTGAKVLVMAHSGSNPDLFLGIVFRREGGELVPERLDLMSFNACYGGLK